MKSDKKGMEKKNQQSDLNVIYLYVQMHFF